MLLYQQKGRPRLEVHACFADAAAHTVLAVTGIYHTLIPLYGKKSSLVKLSITFASRLLIDCQTFVLDQDL